MPRSSDFADDVLSEDGRRIIGFLRRRVALSRASKKRLTAACDVHSNETISLSDVESCCDDASCSSEDDFGNDEIWVEAQTFLQDTCLKIKTARDSLTREYVGRNDGRRKSVSFSDVTIHNHCLTLGDNPAVSSGPPMTLEWKAVDSQELSVDEYEARTSRRRLRSDNHSIKPIPRRKREACLRKNGVSRKEMDKVVREIKELNASSVGAALRAEMEDFSSDINRWQLRLPSMSRRR